MMLFLFNVQLRNKYDDDDEMVFKFIELHYVGWSNSSHPSWIAYYIYFFLSCYNILHSACAQTTDAGNEAKKLTHSSTTVICVEQLNRYKRQSTGVFIVNILYILSYY